MNSDHLSFGAQERGNLRYRCLSLAATCSLLGAVLTPDAVSAHAVIPQPNLVPDVRAAQPGGAQYHNFNPALSGGGLQSAGSSVRSLQGNYHNALNSAAGQQFGRVKSGVRANAAGSSSGANSAPNWRANSTATNAAASSTVSQSSSTTAVNLDLSSSTRSVTAGSLLGSKQ